MVVDVAGRGQRRDVTAVHGAVIGQVHFGPAAVMADCVPPLMGLHSADRGDPDPAMVGVGAGHHPRWPVEQHQAGTPFGLDQPLPPGRLGGHLRDQRSEVLLVGGQLHQEPPHLVHIEDVGGTQLIELSQEVAEWAGEIASAHSLTLTHGPPASLACTLPGARIPDCRERFPACRVTNRGHSAPALAGSSPVHRTCDIAG